MSTLIAHCGASTITREDVMNVVTPQPTGTHYPVSHGKMVKSVIGQLVDDGGYHLLKEEHALTKDGARYFGTFDLIPPNQPEGGDYCLSLGLRNSHDKTFTAGLAVGSRVFVCDNLSFQGDIKVSRKHTRFILRDIDSLVYRALGRLGQQRDKMDTQIAAYKAHEIQSAEAHDLIIKAVDAKALPLSHISKVLQEWRSPSHEEFEPRTAWSLFNAYTQTAKEYSRDSLRIRTQRLHGVLDSHIGLAI